MTTDRGYGKCDSCGELHELNTMRGPSGDHVWCEACLDCSAKRCHVCGQWVDFDLAIDIEAVEEPQVCSEECRREFERECAAERRTEEFLREVR